MSSLDPSLRPPDSPSVPLQVGMPKGMIPERAVEQEVDDIPLPPPPPPASPKSSFESAIRGIAVPADPERLGGSLPIRAGSGPDEVHVVKPKLTLNQQISDLKSALNRVEGELNEANNALQELKDGSILKENADGISQPRISPKDYKEKKAELDQKIQTLSESKSSLTSQLTRATQDMESAKREENIESANSVKGLLGKQTEQAKKMLAERDQIIDTIRTTGHPRRMDAIQAKLSMLGHLGKKISAKIEEGNATKAQSRTLLGRLSNFIAKTEDWMARREEGLGTFLSKVAVLVASAIPYSIFNLVRCIGSAILSHSELESTSARYADRLNLDITLKRSSLDTLKSASKFLESVNADSSLRNECKALLKEAKEQLKQNEKKLSLNLLMNSKDPEIQKREEQLLSHIKKAYPTDFHEFNPANMDQDVVANISSAFDSIDGAKVENSDDFKTTQKTFMDVLRFARNFITQDRALFKKEDILDKVAVERFIKLRGLRDKIHELTDAFKKNVLPSELEANKRIFKGVLSEVVKLYAQDLEFAAKYASNTLEGKKMGVMKDNLLRVVEEKGGPGLEAGDFHDEEHVSPAVRDAIASNADVIKGERSELLTYIKVMIPSIGANENNVSLSFLYDHLLTEAGAKQIGLRPDEQQIALRRFNAFISDFKEDFSKDVLRNSSTTGSISRLSPQAVLVLVDQEVMKLKMSEQPQTKPPLPAPASEPVANEVGGGGLPEVKQGELISPTMSKAMTSKANMIKKERDRLLSRLTIIIPSIHQDKDNLSLSYLYECLKTDEGARELDIDPTHQQLALKIARGTLNNFIRDCKNSFLTDAKNGSSISKLSPKALLGFIDQEIMKLKIPEPPSEPEPLKSVEL